MIQPLAMNIRNRAVGRALVSAGIALYDDLINFEVIEQHLAVNLFGSSKMSRAFLPMLKRRRGAIVNTLSLMALAPLPLTPAYAISKAARGFEIPQASPEVARGIFNGFGNNQEDIFPDPASQSIAEGWRTGVAKAFDRQYTGLVTGKVAVQTSNHLENKL